MSEVIAINERGTMTLPKKLRDRLGVKAGGQVVAEETDDGVLLRLGVTLPLEIYSEKRVAEFERNNEQALAGFKAVKKRKK
ncbi:MAG TPA: AbrB/MazE/SpoVT family DNA-binding domain-containing protein [Verrucomicrobiae bacterium]|jgi:AbrB family looped-hinge helix DNA binding protein